MDKEEWETPSWLFNELNFEFQFSLDVAASSINKKCWKYWTKKEDGLSKSWKGETCFMNPPYSRGKIDLWVQKAWSECFNNKVLVVGLLPVRTSTKWFHNWIYRVTEIRFIKGRLRFERNGIPSKGADRYDSMIVIWRPEK